MSSQRVVLIGPVLPLRGGIAQHTTMLHRALRDEGAALRTLSFSRQYPAWLYPGASDRDADYEGHEERGVEYVIDSLDPRTWRRAAATIARERPDAVVLTWWTVYWALCFTYLARRARRAGIPVVFLCHNVDEHERAGWKRMLTALAYREADRFVVHSRADAANLRAAVAGARVAVHPHPIYEQFPAPGATLARRSPYELLFYGFVRRYKGLDVLLEALARLGDEPWSLTIAGEFWEGEAEARARIRALGLEDRIELRARYHSEQETAQLFERADVVVLPYRSATGSGIVPIAYHYHRPVVVTRTGGLPDVVDEGVTGFVVEPESPAALAEGLARARGFRPPPERFADAKRRMSWQSLARAVLDDGAAS